MAQFAARLGDPTSHLFTPLAGPTGGSTNVLIGGQPAWRAVIDVHICPLSTPNPHGAGMVAMGSTSVLVNNFPAVRMLDTLTEAVGGPVQIVLGCPTVLIGG
jgi:uncharacterized Zn-binding protein involved in type VI secretion